MRLPLCDKREVPETDVHYWGRQGGGGVGMRSRGVASMCLYQEVMVKSVVRREASGPAPLAPVHVVVERVVASESNQGPQAQAVGEEDLGGCIEPYLQAEDQNLRTINTESLFQPGALEVLRHHQLLCTHSRT